MVALPCCSQSAADPHPACRAALQLYGPQAQLNFPDSAPSPGSRSADKQPPSGISSQQAEWNAQDAEPASAAASASGAFATPQQLSAAGALLAAWLAAPAAPTAQKQVKWPQAAKPDRPQGAASPSAAVQQLEQQLNPQPQQEQQEQEQQQQLEQQEHQLNPQPQPPQQQQQHGPTPDSSPAPDKPSTQAGRKRRHIELNCEAAEPSAQQQQLAAASHAQQVGHNAPAGNTMGNRLG